MEQEVALTPTQKLAVTSPTVPEQHCFSGGLSQLWRDRKEGSLAAVEAQDHLGPAETQECFRMTPGSTDVYVSSCLPWCLGVCLPQCLSTPVTVCLPQCPSSPGPFSLIPRLKAVHESFILQYAALWVLRSLDVYQWLVSVL